MAAKRRTRRKAAHKPATRRHHTLSAHKPARRRTKRKTGMLSAGSNYQAIMTQVAMAAAGGIAGVVLRNSIPKTMSDYTKAGITVAGGVAVAMLTKQPMIGAGMIGTGAALAIRKFGSDSAIPILSDQGYLPNARLSENVALYADQMGNPLQKIGNSFYYANGTIAPFNEMDFQRIA